ncbi:hypothetical protein CBS101457_005258 [Exobasidium rhododendri]|nr:hypothetical protein CBS101457_005258 [Exobasidium rhododendri]
MSPAMKKEAESNGREVDDQGNQKIDTLMVKAEPTKKERQEEEQETKDDEQESKDDEAETKNDESSKKREKSDEPEEDNEEQRPSKSAKTEEKKVEKSSNGDAEKVKENPDEEQAALLEVGAEEDIEGKEEGSFKVLERGHILFFYRPKVQSADAVEKSGKSASSINDVQNTHMLLIPQVSESATAPAPTNGSKKTDSNAQPSATTGEKAKEQGVGYRLIKLGKKRLPAPEEAIKSGLQPGGIGGDSSEAIWACVSDIGPDPKELTGSMGEQRYNTRTVGQRYVGPSRPVGRGWYALTLQQTDPPSSRSVKLIYALSHPSEMGGVQTELGLTSSGTIGISIKNPTIPDQGQGAAPVGLEDGAKAEMSKGELKDTFGGDNKDGGTRYAQPENVELLDREGVEMLLTKERSQSGENGAHKGAGEEQAEALQKLAQADSKRLSIQDVLSELEMSTEKHPPEALQGEWI